VSSNARPKSTDTADISQGFRLSAATALHQGDREQQQDQLLLLSHPNVNGCVLAVVADGMGGRVGGRKASNQVILTAGQLFERFMPMVDDPREFLRNIGQQAHMLIRLTAVTTEQQPHSTIAAFSISPEGSCSMIHCGDSRIYYFQGNRFIRRTVDHSYVQALVDMGQITPEAALDHPQSNVVTSCLGTEDEPRLTINFISQLKIGDSLLACSDGLWHYFTNEELANVVSSLPPQKAVQILIRKARERSEGIGDNISVVIVRIDPLLPVKR
jgi:serine/threonine protein phosphatase PrpC